MGKKRLPDLHATGRQYVENTVRARLASPGIERYEGRRGRGARFAVAIFVAVALVAAMFWLS